MKKIAKYALPRKDEELDALANSVYTYAGPHITGANADWTDIPLTSWTAFRTALMAWGPAYDACKVPHLPSQTAEKNQAKLALSDTLSDLINRGLLLSPRTIKDILAMGFHLADTTHTPSDTPATRPEFHLIVKDTRLISVDFRDAGSAHRGKPPGVKGAVIRWSVLPPSGAEEGLRRLQDAVGTGNVKIAAAAFQYSKLATRSPHILDFSETDRGQLVYVVLTWQNGKGDEGSMTEIQNTIIP